MEIDAARGRVYWRGRSEPVAELGGRTRSIELLLLLAREAAGDRAGLTERELARAASGVLDPKAARRYLHELRQLGLVSRDEGAKWNVVIGAGERISALPTSVEHALGLVQRVLGGTKRRTRRAQLHDQRDATVARAELSLARGEPAAAIAVLNTLGEPGKTFIRALLPKLPKSVQDEFMTRAVGLRGIACMNRGETDAALHFLGRAQERALRWKGGLEWLIRLTATEAAAHRMNAALDPDNVDRHVAKCLAAFRRGQSAVDRATALPEETRRELRRWLYAEGTSGLALQATRALAEGTLIKPVSHLADRWLGTAEEELGHLGPDPAALATTHLMRMRFSVLTAAPLGDTGIVTAESSIRAAVEAAERPLTPMWVHGWIPRYDADFAYFATRQRGDKRVLELLATAWKANRGFGFQQLLIIARLASWIVEPDALELEDHEMTRMEETLRTWHMRLRKRPMSHCPTCTQSFDLLRRARCVLRLESIRDARDPLGLGVWR